MESQEEQSQEEVNPLNNTLLLRHSEPNIPTHFMEVHGLQLKYMDFNYITLIKDDIRNMRKLNEHQLQYIKTYVSDKEKTDIIMELVKSFNVCIDVIECIQD